MRNKRSKGDMRTQGRCRYSPIWRPAHIVLVFSLSPRVSQKLALYGSTALSALEAEARRTADITRMAIGGKNDKFGGIGGNGAPKRVAGT
jgi:hypothetical protein